MSRVEPKPPQEQSRQFNPSRRNQPPAAPDRHPSKAEGEEGDVEQALERESEK